jgi:hypothetical protein
MSNFNIDPAYTEVAERMKIARELWPASIFRPVDPLNPYQIVTVKDLSYVVYSAALYRDPEDLLPAIGTAWEEIPGRTPYTKGSELMNAETSAWGRACIAAGIPSKKIASFEEVRNRQELPKATAPTAPIASVEWDPWAVPLSETAPTAPKLDAWNCIHGARKNIEGEKNGRAYFGMGCVKSLNSGEQCETVWFSLNAEGSWVPKLEAVK